MSKQSSIYLDEADKRQIIILVAHNPDRWKNISDFVREAVKEKLARTSPVIDRAGKIENYFKDKEGQ